MNFNYKSFIRIHFYIILVLLLLPTYSLTDVGSCARYKLNIILKNGDSLTCFIQISDYDASIKDWQEEKIFKRMKDYAKNKDNKIVAYKKIQSINYPEGNNFYQYKYTVVAEKDVEVIDSNQISSINKLDVTPCECGNFTKGDQYKIHFTAQVIEGLSQEEINLLQQKPYNQVSFTSPESYDTDYCLNYNKSIDKETLKKICSPSDFYMKEKEDISYEDFEKLQKEYYSKKVEELHKQKIIVLHFYGYT